MGMRWHRTPLQTNDEWDTASHPSPHQLDTIHSTPQLWLLLDHCKCRTISRLEEEENQSDHYKQWNVQVSWNKDSRGLHRHWEFYWRWSTSSTQEAIRLWHAAELWCYQNLGWCSNGKVLRGAPPSPTCLCVQHSKLTNLTLSSSLTSNRKVWTASWKCLGDREPAKLQNSVAKYHVPSQIRSAYELMMAGWFPIPMKNLDLLKAWSSLWRLCRRTRQGKAGNGLPGTKPVPQHIYGWCWCLC